MDYLLEQMETTVILNADDIDRFRQYIAKKYVSYTSAIKAEVLADSICRVVEQNLTGIENALVADIRMSLFKNTLAKNMERINKLHVFNEIVALPLAREQIQMNAMNWIHKNVSKGVSPEEVYSYIEKRNHLPGRVLSREEIDDAVEAAVALVLELDRKSVESKIPAFMPFSPPIRNIKMESVDVSDANALIENMPQWLANSSELQIKLEQTLWHRALLPMGIGIAIMAFATAKTFTGIYDDSFITINEQPSLVDRMTTDSRVLIGTVVQTTVHSEKKKIAKVRKSEKRGLHDNVGNMSNLGYSPFSEAKFRDHLMKLNSKLAEAPYFETILATAKAHEIDPRLLFAIAGQEQSLVRNSSSNATLIANNPFNVYGSWMNYNTDISDSSDIVCNTIVNRLKKKPPEADALIWINETYASDENWNKGVRKFLTKFRAISEE